MRMAIRVSLGITISLLAVTTPGCATHNPTGIAMGRATPQDQGKLQRASDKAAAPTTPDQRHRRPSHSSSSWGDDDEWWGEILGDIFWPLLTLPWWGPNRALEGAAPLRSGYYLRHPYQVPGEPLVGPLRNLEDERRASWHLRFAAEYGTDFDAVDRLATSLRLETAFRVGLDASWSHYREELPAGGSDELDLGDVNLVMRFVQSEHVEMRSGIGLNWLHDDDVDELGFNFTYAGDVYAVKPLVGSFEIDWGRIGAAERFHGRATLGAVWQGVEVLAGFDYESVDSVGLPSWIVGGRVWY